MDGDDVPIGNEGAMWLHGDDGIRVPCLRSHGSLTFWWTPGVVVVEASEPFQVLVRSSIAGVTYAVAVHGADTVCNLRQQVAARERQPVHALLCDGKPLRNEGATVAAAQVTPSAVLRVLAGGLAGGADTPPGTPKVGDKRPGGFGDAGATAADAPPAKKPNRMCHMFVCGHCVQLLNGFFFGGMWHVTAESDDNREDATVATGIVQIVGRALGEGSLTEHVSRVLFDRC